MKRILIAGLAMAAAFVLTSPASADEAVGEVKEIIIKIQTADGPRWYALGKDLKEIDINEGDVVQFNYADDTIESIEVQDVGPSGGSIGDDQ
jgi:hypothetical protein